MSTVGKLGCIICGRTMAEGATLYRVNAKGQPGIWACAKHINDTDSKPDAETVQVVTALGGKAPRP
jgi:hypothetical protein